MMTLVLMAVWGVGPVSVETIERFRAIEAARQSDARGWTLWNAGKRQEAVNIFLETVKARETLYSAATHPDGHAELADSIDTIAWVAKQSNNLPVAERYQRRALEMCEKLYSKARYPDGHPQLAGCLNELGYLYHLRGKHAMAEPLLRRALSMQESRYSRLAGSHPDLATSLNNLGTLLRDCGKYTEAELLLQRALAIREKLYNRIPGGHPTLAASLDHLASLYLKRGDTTKAEPLFRRALKMHEALYGRLEDGHPDLATSLSNLGALLSDRSEYVEAEAVLQQALAMREKLYGRLPIAHPDLARSLTKLGELHTQCGDHEKAAPLLQRALDMYENLSDRLPQGHQELARILNTLGVLKHARGEDREAEALFLRALAMCEKEYGRLRGGHPELATSLNNLGGFHLVRGDLRKAEPLLQRALDMREKLYPDKRDPGIGVTLTNLAALHVQRGDLEKSERLFRRALEALQQFYPEKDYPDGNHLLATCLNNLAGLHRDRGEPEKAKLLHHRALVMYTAEVANLAPASEASASNIRTLQPQAGDGYLTVTAGSPNGESYTVIWPTKAVIARIAEARHLATLAATSVKARELLNAIRSLRHDRERLLLAPYDKAKADDRTKRLDVVNEQIRQKEENLRPLVPGLKRFKDLTKKTPHDLRQALPADAAFVDLIRYTRFERDPKLKGEKRTPCYVAFVVTRDAVIRVELKEAKPIEDALELWRSAIVEHSPAEPKYARELHRLVWSPLREHLPAKMTTVHVCPDAALNRLPWAALRDGRTGRILIEDHAVAVVPHGPFLLDHLTRERRKPEVKPTLLAMGGVAYDERPRAATELASRSPAGDGVKWTPLAGTAKEVRQILALAGDRRLLRREGAAASPDALLADLPHAETAHLATHGFFADPKFRTVFQLDPKLFDRPGMERATHGARNPLVLSGLVCAGANLPDTPNRGVVTADAIVGLDLRRLNLAVLSACETGLGETAGGEAVYGLTRAFHVAGCRNVAASLWKVDDEATAALMVLFYRHLWDAKNPVGPAEAMRRAQLAVYRNPGLIKEWAVGRGPIPRPVPGSAATPEKLPAGKTSPAKAWAAFVVSGPGD